MFFAACAVIFNNRSVCRFYRLSAWWCRDCGWCRWRSFGGAAIGLWNHGCLHKSGLTRKKMNIALRNIRHRIFRCVKTGTGINCMPAPKCSYHRVLHMPWVWSVAKVTPWCRWRRQGLILWVPCAITVPLWRSRILFLWKPSQFVKLVAKLFDHPCPLRVGCGHNMIIQ